MYEHTCMFYVCFMFICINIIFMYKHSAINFFMRSFHTFFPKITFAMHMFCKNISKEMSISSRKHL